MKKSIIIAGFAGIGKTDLSKKYKNVIDIESSFYKYDYSNFSADEQFNINAENNCKRNPDFPKNYISAIKAAQKKYAVVFVHLDVFEMLKLYEKNNIKYTLCYPDQETLLKVYYEKFRSKGGNDFAENKIKLWYLCMEYIKNDAHKKIVLSGNDTLEAYLIKNGYISES